MALNKLSTKEYYAVLSLAGIYACRMLGLFMILPVFTLYAENLRGHTPLLVGIALGIYGLAQACLQVPFGMLSDFFGRKRVIIFGLLLFALGSAIAALSHSIGGVIIGRTLQGAGAVGSTLTALTADLTREENRTKAMAIIGMVIALSFCVAMLLGPVVNAWIGVPGIFWLTTALAGCGIVVLLLAVPTPQLSSFHSDAQLDVSFFWSILSNVDLLRQDIAIFLLHAILTASFIAVPVTLVRIAGLSEEAMFFVFLPVIVCAFAVMIPLVIIAEKYRRMRQVYSAMVGLIFISQLLLWQLHGHLIVSAMILFLFFTAFITLEATIPSLVSKIAPAARKGTALGIYSSFQFLGIFAGGSFGGVFFHLYGISGVFLFAAALGMFWLLTTIGMKEPRYVSNYIMRIGHIHKADAQRLRQRLLQIPGIIEASVQYKESAAYLKIDKSLINPEDLQAMTVTTHH